MSAPTVVGEVDERAVDQIRRCAEEGDAIASGICADGHVGYSQPIGGFVAYEGYVSPSGVGYDIGCGNKAVATSIMWQDLRPDISGVMDEIARRISFGMGVPAQERVDDPIIDRIRTESPTPRIAALHQKAAAQLGTVGSGNHYVDLFRDEETDRVWIGVHFGSRGFGHTVASGFLALAAGLGFDERAKEGEMDSPPVLLRTDTPLGHSYIEAMHLAGEYAYAGRNAVCSKVLEILGAEEFDSVHNHHNFAWQEEHFGAKVWVVRKGCTPAFPGQRGFVGATMGEPSVILRGADPLASTVQGPREVGTDSLQRLLLYSTVHGAGRVMSRTEAAGGRPRWRWTCCNRNCDWVQPKGTHKPDDGCPKCRHPKLRKQPVQVRRGRVDWDAARRDLRARGIELRGAAADEAPEAYKRLDEVLSFHEDTVEVEHRLIPVGVCMAGPDIHDPFKD
jgi:tRNA-splicing ligase RtcB (3'-phosphate/5'-hydroxy nucleic acid ligase)